MKTLFLLAAVVSLAIVHSSKNLQQASVTMFGNIADGIERIITGRDTAEIRSINESSFDTAIANPDRVVILAFINESSPSSKSQIREIEAAIKDLPSKVLLAKVSVEDNEMLLRRLGVHEVPSVMIYAGGEVQREYSKRIEVNELVSSVSYYVNSGNRYTRRGSIELVDNAPRFQ